MVWVPERLAEQRPGGEHAGVLLLLRGLHRHRHPRLRQRLLDPGEDAGEDDLDAVDRQLLGLHRLDDVLHAVHHVLDEALDGLLEAGLLLRGGGRLGGGGAVPELGLNVLHLLEQGLNLVHVDTFRPPLLPRGEFLQQLRHLPVHEPGEVRQYLRVQPSARPGPRLEDGEAVQQTAPGPGRGHHQHGGAQHGRLHNHQDIEGGNRYLGICICYALLTRNLMVSLPPGVQCPLVAVSIFNTRLWLAGHQRASAGQPSLA